MPINTGKITSLKQMLMKLYWGNDTRTLEELEKKVESTIIDIATTEQFIIREKGNNGSVVYRITPKGKQERDK